MMLNESHENGESAENDELVMGLMESVLALPKEEREPFLKTACGPDIALFHELRERVAWEERMGNFLREPVVARYPQRQQLLAPGAVVNGRFQIVGEPDPDGVYQAIDLHRDARVELRSVGVDGTSDREIHRVETAEGPWDFTAIALRQPESPGAKPPGWLRGLFS